MTNSEQPHKQPARKSVELQPNPPEWPSSVLLFHPTDDPHEIVERVAATQDPWNETKQTYVSDNHFSPNRFALLFAPGEYRLPTAPGGLEIGYYVQLLGLGRRADDVTFVENGPTVPALNKDLHPPFGTCLDTFWRSAENFRVRDGDLRWAVSQAAPLRRVIVDKGGDLWLHDGAAYASGGHLANAVIVEGHLYAGGQQQFLLRNVEVRQAAAEGGAWSMVYVGCEGGVPVAQPGTETSPAVTVVPEPPVRLEKPFVAMNNDNGRFELRVPQLIQKENGTTAGARLDGSFEQARDFDRVCVIPPDATTARIQEALDQGLDVVLTPGIYRLDRTLQVYHPNQVLLGIGMATLEAPTDGSPAIHVTSGVPGVRIAGVTLEVPVREEGASSSTPTISSLLEWGEDGVVDQGQADNPGGLFDVFCRVGGPTTGDRTQIWVDTMMRLHSGHLIGDNLWLWRADHGALRPGEAANYPDISPLYWQTEQDEFRVQTGLEVKGDHVHLFGLAVEHALGHQTVWKGQHGSVYFYQCELPYDVDQAFADRQYRGYLVDPGVTHHEVYAPGVYSNFRNAPVVVDTSMEHGDGVVFHNAFGVKLDNQGGLGSIVNGNGGAALTKGTPVRLPAATATKKD